MSGRVEISKRLVLINSASSILTRCLSISVLVWLNAYLVNRVSPEEYSLLVMVNAVMMFAPLITMILAGGLGRYIVEAYAREDDDRVVQIVSTMAPILTLAALVMLGIGGVFAWYIDFFLKIAPEDLWDARIMMGLLLFTAAIRLPVAPFSIGLFVQQRFVLANMLRVGTELFRLSLLFILLFGVGTRVLWVVVATASAEFLNLFVVLFISCRTLPVLRFRRESINWSIAGELTSFGGWSFVASLADTIRTNADVLILNRMATAVDVSSFNLGTLAMRHIHQTSVVARAPLGPALTAMYATQDSKRTRNVFIRGGRIALWTAMLPSIPLMVFNREFMTLYAPPEFIQAGSVMLVSLLLFPIAYGSTMTAAIANAQGKVKTWSLIIAAMNVVNLGFTFYLVGRLEMGAMGSAVATLISLVLFYPLFVYPFGLRMVGVGWGQWFRETLVPGFLPALVALGVTLVVKFTWAQTSWWTLGFAAVPGMVVYCIALLWILPKQDRDDLSRVMDKVRAQLTRRGTEDDG